MSKLPFSKEIVRGVVLGVLLLSGMFLGIAIYHSATTQRAQASPAIPSAVEASVEIATPDTKLGEHLAPVPSPAPLSIGQPSRAANTGAPKAPAPKALAMTTAVHEEEAAPPLAPSSEESTVAAQEQPAEPIAASSVSGETPQQSPNAIAESPQTKPENRGARWIKSLGRRLHIGGK